MFATNLQPAYPEPVPGPAHPELVEGLDTPSPLADIVREETSNGRLIVRFLIDLMQGSLENAKPCHRLDAARQLFNLGWTPARSIILASAPPTRRFREGGNLAPSQDPLHPDLAALVRDETDDGRAAVRFLVDVMQGNLENFKPHHRLSAAKELLRRGFDNPSPEPASQAQPETGAVAEAEVEAEQSPRLHDRDGIYSRGADGKWHREGSMSPARVPDDVSCQKAEPPEPVPERPASYNRYLHEYGPFYFESYDEEDLRRDCFGVFALNHILGSDGAVRSANIAVTDYHQRQKLWRINSDQPDNPSPGAPVLTDDFPLPEAIYGYPALLRIFRSEAAVRVAVHAARRYYRDLLQGRTANSEGAEYTGFPSRSRNLPSEHPPSSGPGSGPERIRLGSPSLGATDSLTVGLYLYADELHRSVRPAFPLISGPSPPALSGTGH